MAAAPRYLKIKVVSAPTDVPTAENTMLISMPDPGLYSDETFIFHSNDTGTSFGSGTVFTGTTYVTVDSSSRGAKYTIFFPRIVIESGFDLHKWIRFRGPATYDTSSLGKAVIAPGFQRGVPSSDITVIPEVEGGFLFFRLYMEPMGPSTIVALASGLTCSVDFRL